MLWRISNVHDRQKRNKCRLENWMKKHTMINGWFRHYRGNMFRIELIMQCRSHVKHEHTCELLTQCNISARWFWMKTRLHSNRIKTIGQTNMMLLHAKDHHDVAILFRSKHYPKITFNWWILFVYILFVYYIWFLIVFLASRRAPRYGLYTLY